LQFLDKFGSFHFAPSFRVCRGFAPGGVILPTGRFGPSCGLANQNPPVYGFDCVCLIKGVLWGWNGNASKTYGGAGYAVNGVPDIGADTMITKCSGVSTDFSKIVPGEAVWLKGHIGVYIGGGKVIECTPAFKNCVQVTACLNIGAISGMNGRKWTKHGKLPYITYDTAESPQQGAQGGAGTPKPSGGAPDTSGALAFSVGDVVRFTGNRHYTNANASSGPACKPGTAKVTAIAKGTKHPYHLIKQSGGGPPFTAGLTRRTCKRFPAAGAPRPRKCASAHG